MRTTLRLNARIFPVIGVIAFVMQIVEPSRAWVILLIGIGGTWLFCWWWVRGLARSLEFRREMRYGWAQVGDRLEERFTLSNRFPLPATWVAVHDQSTLPDHRSSVATGVDGSSTSQWKILNQCTKRGVYTLGGTILETGDPFGIYTLTLEDPASSTLAVMPPVVPLPYFNILSSGWTGEGRRNPRSLEETLNASHTREMTPGDPLKWIHWKTTARRGTFHVRQAEGTHAGDWWILLDLHKGSQVGEGWDSTEEHAVILASSLIAQGLRDDHSVGLAINAREPAWHVPRRNEHQQRAPEVAGGGVALGPGSGRLPRKDGQNVRRSLQPAGHHPLRGCRLDRVAHPVDVARRLADGLPPGCEYFRRKRGRQTVSLHFSIAWRAVSCHPARTAGQSANAAGA